MPVFDKAVVLSASDWNRARREPAFIELLRIARITNALSIAYPPLMGTLKRQTPRARRERTAAFFYAGALLSEGLDVADCLGKHYAELEQFQSGFGELLSSTDTKELRKSFLRPLRNKAGFHVDREVFTSTLAELTFPEYHLALATDWRTGSVYFGIVDDAILLFLTKARDDAEHVERLHHLMTGTAKLVNQYVQCAHRLLPRAYSDFGARRGRARRDPGSAR